jgi:hypothetical protein
MVRAFFYWAAAGVGVPVLILVLAHLQGGVISAPRLAIALWPSAILLRAVHDASPFAILASLISIGLNVVWYTAVGTMVWLFCRLRLWTTVGEDRVSRTTQIVPPLALGLAAILDGGLSLFFAYAGTLPMVWTVFLGAVAAPFLVRRVRRRTQGVSPEHDTGGLVMSAAGWLILLAVVAGGGSLSHASEKAFFEGGIGLTAVFVIICATISLAGSVAVQLLVFHFLALRSHSAGSL